MEKDCIWPQRLLTKEQDHLHNYINLGSIKTACVTKHTRKTGNAKLLIWEELRKFLEYF